MQVVARYWGRKPVELIKPLIKDLEGVVVDPFGGSGSIVYAALELGKKGVYIDLNPYAWLVAHVFIAKADHKKFIEAASHVVDKAYELLPSSSSAKLKGDYLRYGDRPFLKRRNFDRVSDFFSAENRKKLRSILRAIDSINADANTKLALYLAFCNTLYPSSLMKRCGAGSWGVPSYWAPEKSCPEDPFNVFVRVIRNMLDFFSKHKHYKVAYNLNSLDTADAVLLLEDGISFNKYRSSWALVTDPPHVDEVQYMELSFFYWAWLRESNFRNIVRSILGKYPRYWFSKELTVNPNRNQTLDSYMACLLYTSPSPRD